jgi:hypothetical protein
MLKTVLWVPHDFYLDSNLQKLFSKILCTYAGTTCTFEEIRNYKFGFEYSQTHSRVWHHCV